jgi:hypothetical protein
MRICLFDWNSGGHHQFYARTFAAALAGRAEVVVAGSDALLGDPRVTGVEHYSLGEPRPRPGTEAGCDKASLAKREIELLREAIADIRPDQAVVLLADPIMRWLATSDPLPCPTGVFIMFASSHYPGAYGLRLTPRERLSAEFKERNIRRWRRRHDASVLFGLDAEAVARWQQRPGAPALWLPEPPLETAPPIRPASEKHGCFLFGYFDERKGMNRLADALAEGADGLELALFGDVAPEYREALELELDRMRAGGVQLETDFRRVPYEDAMEKMAEARCAFLSFGWRPAASRVLLEAAAARTPVVVGSDSPVGRLVERHGLGRTADPRDPVALREAILTVALDPSSPERYQDNLRRYADELHGDHFAEQVRKGLGVS